MTELSFRHLNPNWNAEPNAPDVELVVEGDTVQISFLLKPLAHDAEEGESATLRFVGCSRWQWDASDDRAWFAGEGRYSNQAPKWGAFYEVTGESRATDDWEILAPDSPNSRHFVLCFRDDIIEFVARDWSLTRKNA
ncbi:hypothetical protein EOB36_03885 [Mesorhizobium sp. M6A.T.Cr.TU.017.01.1.1]|uniref:hypothetical protein n=1 Tax=Mesorhizobium sp. M6A.T.Cr.TU.017.01.1.1 TaxID=2496774 RepID=UPI000FD2BFBC|nr:hypothetical protein [Mesorhizobium sp. M6A.T.Cr.TU.017.01.1.1]RUV04176.1 hypothetical protein EOB36_03885 [Mesorhizobium sp. M6A.T.Cr.TU.017.01.1.1]